MVTVSFTVFASPEVFDAASPFDESAAMLDSANSAASLSNSEPSPPATTICEDTEIAATKSSPYLLIIKPAPIYTSQTILCF